MGFPDVALLEPLADALGLTVRSLLRGEAEPPEVESAGTVSAVPEDILLREVIRTLYQQQRGKLRRNIGRIFGALVALVLVGSFLLSLFGPYGFETNFTAFDLRAQYAIDPAEFLSMGRSTPFAGETVFGRCRLTVSDGRIAYMENPEEN